MTDTNKTDALIDAATEYAKCYDGDDRACIKTDVMNAFYRGAAWHAGLGENDPLREELRFLKGHHQATLRRLSEAEAELATQRSLSERLSELLTQTADALKGTPDPRMAHSWHDLPDWAAKARAVPMSLLASTAPGATHIQREDFVLAVNAWRTLYGRDFFETTRALAMLDNPALQGSTAETCGRCGKPWDDHDFGVPAPTCP